ncbi:MAG: hypothetical protein KDE51_05845 [Anaerolineales bacterium]|nr:hypothetical protein [Anaerolineales bacterium]
MNRKSQLWKSLKYLDCILCLLFLSACATQSNNPQWVTVKHEQYNFSIDYPTKWVVNLYGEVGYKGVDEQKLIIGPQRPTFGLPSPSSTFSIIVRQRPFDNPSLQDALKWGNETIDQNPLQEGLQTKPGYKEFLFQEEEIAGYNAIRQRYTYSYLGGMIIEELYIPRENDMIIISLGVQEEYFNSFYPDFQRIVNSFKTIP